MVSYAIKVIWPDGAEEFLKEGPVDSGEIASFASPERADEQRIFMMEGMAEDVQSINVVPHPGRTRR